MKVDYRDMDFCMYFEDVNPGEFFFVRSSDGWNNTGYIKLADKFATTNGIVNAVDVNTGSFAIMHDKTLVYCIENAKITL